MAVPPPVVMVVCPPNVLPTKGGFHPGRRGKSSQLFCSTSFSPSYEGWKQGACLGVEVRCVVPYMFVHVRMECAAFVCVCVGVLYTCQRLQEAVDHTARHRQTRLLWVWKQILQ